MATAEAEPRFVIIHTDDARRIKLRCPVCGDEGWLQAQGAKDVDGFQPVLLANSTNKGLVSVPIMQLFCQNCGYSIQFGSVENVTLEIPGR
ncbi:MAG TPA: hypothetical protein VKQ73_15430 [Stellaceae bacterium]|nr:hypothetical protein [Stellaceae bacterium]